MSTLAKFAIFSQFLPRFFSLAACYTSTPIEPRVQINNIQNPDIIAIGSYSRDPYNG